MFRKKRLFTWGQRKKHVRLQQAIIASVLLLGSILYLLWRRFFVHLPSGETDYRNMQLLRDGTGPIVFRRYWVEISNPTLSTTQLMEQIQADLNDFVPKELAYFEPEEKEQDKASVQHHAGFFIDIAGPWNGPVRVAGISPTSFTLVTLEEHLEAGEICFRVVEHPRKPHTIIFEIFSFARSKDINVHIAYNILRGAKIAQTSMWVLFCNSVLELSGGESEQGVQTSSQSATYESYIRQQEDNWKTYAADLDSFQETELNYVPEDAAYQEDDTWNYDEYRGLLPPQVMAPDGFNVWETANDIVERYEFPSPSIVRGFYKPESSLEERLIVIEAYFWFFKFVFGLRVHEVIDEERTDPERGKAYVKGFSYQTLEGHFEMGEMWFEVIHYVETDQVEFCIRAYSRRATITNPFYRLGFSMFGRRVQERYAHLAVRRMQALVVQRMNETRQQQMPDSTPNT